MYYLFSFFFFFLFIVCLFGGIYMITYNSLMLEFLLPFSYFMDYSLCFCFDYISLFFFSCVSLISSMVFLYSKYYMASSINETSDNNRFFLILFLFVVSMFFLVFSFSWMIVMLGWDGLGVVSFLLVIYYNNYSSLDSGLITILINRLGDCFFILGFIFMMYNGWACLDYFLNMEFLLFSLLIFFGCITKSAQMPFSSWLPAAMAAPTPVSSLVHSSTLVTAGVYLLLRFNFLFLDYFHIFCVISLFTMFISGYFAILEFDFKKVVAMSTLSQLGFMIFSISCGLWWLSFLHMMFHAFFKSSLFLSTGSLMHFLLGDQDSRLFGGFFNSFFSKLFFSCSCLSLMGFPFSLGFYSKDVIIGEFMFSNSSFFYLLFIASCCFTVCYSLRLLNLGYMNFPSYFSSLSFVEDLFFFLPVFLLFLVCCFCGNFFFMFFIPVSYFSFFDYICGIFIILLGVLLFLFINFFYFQIYSLSNMLFLNNLTIFSSFILNNLLLYNSDATWGENSSSKGINLVFKKIFLYGMWLYKGKFLHFMFVGFIFYMFVM